MNSFVRYVAILAGFGCFVTGPYATAASPATNHYFGVGYFQQHTEFDTDAGPFTSNPDSFILKYGYTLFRNVAIEVHAGTSAKEVNETNDKSVATDYLFSVFARGELPLPAQNITLYGLLGATRAKATYETEQSVLGIATPVSYSKEASGLSYGLGVELYGLPSTSFHIEWMKYLSADEYISNGFVFGITHHFGMPKLW